MIHCIKRIKKKLHTKCLFYSTAISVCLPPSIFLLIFIITPLSLLLPLFSPLFSYPFFFSLIPHHNLTYVMTVCLLYSSTNTYYIITYFSSFPTSFSLPFLFFHCQPFFTFVISHLHSMTNISLISTDNAGLTPYHSMIFQIRQLKPNYSIFLFNFYPLNMFNL